MLSPDLDQVLSIGLSQDELWLLLSLQGPVVALGLPNPYLGWLAAEIETAQRQALASLLARDLARQVSPQEIALDEALAALVGAIARADHSLIVQWQRPGGVEARCFVHFSRGLIVEQAEPSPKQFRLTAWPDRAALAAHLQTTLHADADLAGQGAAFQLPEAAYQQARALASRGQAAEGLALLQASGLSPAAADRLQAVLAGPVASSSAVILVNRTQPETQHVVGFAVLEGQADRWVLQPFERNGQTWVTFSPADAAAVRQRFMALLR